MHLCIEAHKKNEAVLSDSLVHFFNKDNYCFTTFWKVTCLPLCMRTK